MGIFSAKKKDAAEATPKPKKAKATKAAVKAVEKTEKTEKIGATASKTDRSSFVLVSPRVSEKAAVLSSKGTYVFNVPVTAEKIEIRKAVESLYGVKVERVNTVRGIGKVVHRGGMSGRRSNWKKALVTLKAGEKLDLYQGV